MSQLCTLPPHSPGLTPGLYTTPGQTTSHSPTSMVMDQLIYYYEYTGSSSSGLYFKHSGNRKLILAAVLMSGSTCNWTAVWMSHSHWVAPFNQNTREVPPTFSSRPSPPPPLLSLCSMIKFYYVQPYNLPSVIITTRKQNNSSVYSEYPW